MPRRPVTEETVRSLQDAGVRRNVVTVARELAERRARRNARWYRRTLARLNAG